MVLDRVLSLDVGERVTSGDWALPRLLPRRFGHGRKPRTRYRMRCAWFSTGACCRATIPTRPLPPSQTRLPSGSRGGWTRVAGRTCFRPKFQRAADLRLPCRRDAVARVLPEMSTFHSSGALDAGLFHALGADAAMWGPGDMGLWHSDDEGISIDELEQGARGYLGLIEAWFQ